MKITPHTKLKARQLQIKGLGIILLAAIVEAGGTLELAGEKKGSKQHPAWREIKKVAPECFHGERSEQWAHLIVDKLGIVFSGGRPYSGKLVATLAPEKEELKMSKDVRYAGLEFQVDQPNLTKAEKEELAKRMIKFIGQCIKDRTADQVQHLLDWADLMPEGPEWGQAIVEAFYPEQEWKS